ncbi:hypothetical protein [Rhodopirellula sp. MGV]|uniref:hypothetical protein n=1 Tax=Rhodopirellula sp. MGV TaxID=2023130 RepID=UPI000B95F500|nr:hypothetical protein [Rhodopirellula sp. MGV]OYP38829.1 hypothetical protein CGZ80_00980 [Rhodopirellula sp. MGV]PNY37640.1 hypothetical protein C2E31_06715 [Rhodopirellula baltica]
MLSHAEVLASLEPVANEVLSIAGANAREIELAIRERVDPDQVTFLSAVIGLQPKAHRKFGSGFWWCDERSLAQATHQRVASLKASWLSGFNVFDICCGIGADALATARSLGRGNSLLAVDSDPLTAAMAMRNLAMHLPVDAQWQVNCMDAAEVQLRSESLIHLDPDRRTKQGRKTRPEDYSPSWEVVETLINQCDGAVAKIAPAADIEDHPNRHRVWISYSSSVREQTILTGRAIESASKSLSLDLPIGGRSAVIVCKQTSHVFAADRARCEASQIGSSVTDIKSPLGYIIAPDPAIRAAGLTEAFAERHGLSTLGGPAGFLTSDTPVEGPLAICRPVLWSGSSDDRKLRRTLRDLDSYPASVKTRGAAVDANTLERRYRTCGETPVTLWIGKTGKRQYAVISEA